MKKKLETFSIKFTHPDPKKEEEAAKAFEELVIAIGKLTGEEVKVLKHEHIEDHDKPNVHGSHEEKLKQG